MSWKLLTKYRNLIEIVLLFFLIIGFGYLKNPNLFNPKEEIVFFTPLDETDEKISELLKSLGKKIVYYSSSKQKLSFLEKSVIRCDIKLIGLALKENPIQYKEYNEEYASIQGDAFSCDLSVILFLHWHGIKIDYKNYFENKMPNMKKHFILYYLVTLGQSVKMKNSFDETLLVKEARYADRDRIRLLLYLGSSLKEKNILGYNPLQIAVDYNNYPAVEEIIQFQKDEHTERKTKALEFYKEDYSKDIFLYEEKIEFPNYQIGKTLETELNNLKANHVARYSFQSKREKKFPSQKIFYDRIYTYRYSADTLKIKDKSEYSKSMNYFFLNGVLQYMHEFVLYEKDIKCYPTGCSFRDCRYPEDWSGQKRDLQDYKNEKLKSFATEAPRHGED